MPMENQLAHAITQTEYDLSYDKAAKKLLANKQILAQIMKNCVNEYSACSVDEIAEKYIEGTGTVLIHTVLHNLCQNLFVGKQLLGSLIITRIIFRLRYRTSKLIFHRHSLPYSRFKRRVYFPYCAFILP